MEPSKQEPTEGSEQPLSSTKIDVLPGNAFPVKDWWKGYKHVYTTGPFQLPENSGSLDWVVLNNDGTDQKIRVTVFKCGIGTTKTDLPPGPLELTLGPGETTHNANTYPEGFIYEIQVETNSRLIFPYASVWPGNLGVIIPGTGIPAASFIRRLS